MQSSKAMGMIVLFFCVCTLSAAAQSGNTATEEAAIKEARRLQTQALAKNDLDTVVKYWDPAITIRRALGHPVDGAAAARKLLEPASAATQPQPSCIKERRPRFR